MSDQMSLDAWAEASSANTALTVDQLDKIAQEYYAADKLYEEAKEKSKELYAVAEELEKKLVAALEASGKRKYHVDGIGTFSFVEKMSVQVPKTIEDKQLLAKYLEQVGGKTYFWDKFSVNSQTLQGLYKSEFEAYKVACEKEGDAGKAATFELPGVGAPQLMRSLKLTAEKKGK